MLTPQTPALRSSDFEFGGLDSRPLRRLASRGVMTRVVPGAYVNAGTWRALDARQQYVVVIHERVRRLTSPVVVSHWSAAAVWGFPVADDWPRDVQVIDPTRASSNRIASLHRRPGVIDDVDVLPWQGLSITTPARTAADLALVEPFEVAVMLFDHGLRTGAFDKADVAYHLDRRPEARRRRSARDALDFASPKAEWPGESFSRVGLVSRGLELPDLQQPFDDHLGRIGYVDMWWKSCGVVGEFDGVWKYTDERFLRGRTVAQAIRDEKQRQARLEAHPAVRRVVRWEYSVARNADELARLLRAAGVPDRGRGPGRR